MRITSAVPDLSAEHVGRILSGLPDADGYVVHVKFLKYRDRPHLSAWTDLTEHSITLQLPEPFLPFGEVVPYAAKRRPGAGRMRFIWLSEGLTFRTPREVLRFLYCHEWIHAMAPQLWSGRRVGETVSDRFALFNFRRASVVHDDAEHALRWRRGDPRFRPADQGGLRRPVTSD